MHVYAPGRDEPPAPNATSDAVLAIYNPSRGAGGVFAHDIQGTTPKYARNEGERHDNFRDSLCRFFVRVDANDRDLFRRTVTDPAIGGSVLDAISGDPRGNKGYVDFLITQANLGFQELIQVGQVLSGSHIVYTFDQAPPTLRFQGVTLNTVQDDQTTHMIRLYLNLLRATALARRQKALSIKIDAYVLTGVLQSMDFTFESKFETAVPFSASFLVKRLAIVEYTAGWRPTSVSSAFATDLNAVPADTRVYTERPVNAVSFRRPGDLEEEVARGEADARVGTAPPAAPADPRPSELAVAQAEQLRAGAASARAQETVDRTEREVAAARARIERAERALQAEGGLFGDAFAARNARLERSLAQAELDRAVNQRTTALRDRDQAPQEAMAAGNRINALRVAPPPPATTPAPAAPLPPAVRSSPAPETTAPPPRTSP